MIPKMIFSQRETSTNTKKKDFLLSLYAVGVLLAICLLWAPSEFYWVNAKEFWFSLRDIMAYCILFFAVAFIIISALLFLVGTRIRLLATSLAVSLAFGLYIQGNWINADYGLLNGNEINWDNYKIYSIINFGFWTFIIIFPVILLLILKREKWMMLITRALNIFVIFLVVSFITIGISSGSTDTSTAYASVTNKDQFLLGDEQNVVVFILDSFDSNLYDLILKEDGTLFEFEDFTYFSNTTGGYPTTQASIPYIITGAEYSNQEPYYDWLLDAYKNAEIFNVLENLNYNIGVYEAQFIPKYGMEDMIDNLNYSGRAEVGNKIGLFRKYMDFVLFRYMPHQFKPYFVAYTGELEQYKGESEYKEDDVQFYQKLISEGLQIREGSSSFRFYHLQGAHPPYSYDTELNEVEESRQPLQARGSLNIVKKYIEYLKQLGIYDQTAIVICADHGSSAWSELSVAPLLMIKKVDEHHPFSIDDTAVSYSELNNSIISLIDSNESRDTVWDNEENPLTERRFLYYALMEDNRDTNYMPRMYEYWIRDEFTDLRKGDYFYTEEGTQEIEYFTVDDFLEIDITDDKQYLKLCDYGLQYFPNLTGTGGYRWTSGKETSFTLIFNQIECNYRMDINVSGTLGSQNVICYVEDVKLLDAHVDENISVEIPNTVIPSDGKVQIILQWPDAVRPSDYYEDGSTDYSIYAVRIKDITFQVEN